MTDKEAFDLIASHAVPGTEADAGPLSRLRYKLRMAFTDGTFVSTYGLQRRMAEVLEAPEWMQAAEEANALRTSLAHWKVFGEHAEGERSRLKHNEAVMMNALYKACGDDEEMVRQTIESQGVLRPDPALLARCPTGKCDDPARDCFGSGCLGPN